METVESIKKKLGYFGDGELASALGVEASAVSNWKKKGRLSAPAERKALQLLKEMGGDAPEGGFTLIPLYDVEASAGGGTFVEVEAIVDRIAFKEDWIKHVLRVSPKDLALITTTGDSMEPTLSPGDMVMLDLSVNRITSNAVYVLQVGGTLMVKRIQRMIDGRVIIRSDNATYEAETVMGDDGLNIIGRVIWAGRKF